MGEDNISKKSFIYYHDWAEELLKYPDDLRLKIDDAIKKYVLYGEEPTDREIIFSIFGIIKKQLDRDSDKWDSIRKKRAEAGRKGGLKTQSNFRENQANQANASFDKQNQANQAVNGNVNVNVNNIIKESNKLDSSSNSGESDSPQEPRINFEGLKDFFNAEIDRHGSVIPKITTLSEERKKMLRCRVREYGKEAVMKVIQNAAGSDFLNGKNGFVASFDWLIRPRNFPKVLEGNYQNYDNPKINNNETQQRDRFSERRGTEPASKERKGFKGTFQPRDSD